ncbi:MAG: hypothetical protein ACJA0N_000050 [Pseudohongiellaceae bacterium]|jgi:hypothetical protein
MSLVTIVIPCYNHQESVVGAAESVLEQDHPETRKLTVSKQYAAAAGFSTGKTIESYKNDTWRYVS